jgi:hypothetical protein
LIARIAGFDCRALDPLRGQAGLPEVIQHCVDVVWTNLPLDAVLDHRCPADDLQYRLNDAFFSYERPRILGGLQPLLHHPPPL